MQPVVAKFRTFREAEMATRDYYRRLSPALWARAKNPSLPALYSLLPTAALVVSLVTRPAAAGCGHSLCYPLRYMLKAFGLAGDLCGFGWGVDFEGMPVGEFEGHSLLYTSGIPRALKAVVPHFGGELLARYFTEPEFGEEAWRDSKGKDRLDSEAHTVIEKSLHDGPSHAVRMGRVLHAE